MVESMRMDILMSVAWLDANRLDEARSDSGSKTYPVLNQQDLTAKTFKNNNK